MAERHPERSEGSRLVRLLVTIGDPAGIGPEVVLRALAHPLSFPPSVHVTVIGDLALLRSLARRLRLRVPWPRHEWVDLPNAGSVRPGKVQAAAGRAARAYIEEAVRRLRAGEADALVTGPVSKEAIVRAGIPWRGHTEYLERSFRRRATMMFVTGRFRVSLVTTHWPIRRVPGRITRVEVTRALAATRTALIRDFGIRRPRIGLAALNPHAGEGGVFGGEEKKILLPAVRASITSARTARSAHPEPFGKLRAGFVEGWRIEGPVPSDTLMQRAAAGRYDAVVALYHDQALIPVKILGWERAVNVTLGLPFVRTSPVHGTAFDLAGKGRADPSSMCAALDLAVRLARRRK